MSLMMKKIKLKMNEVHVKRLIPDIAILFSVKRKSRNILPTMKKFRAPAMFCFILLLHGFSVQGIFSEDDKFLSSDIVKKVNDSVYEVIVPKPVEENITYEKELPMHLIPYAVRTDKYYSIGSAFKIDKTKFITASHVLLLGDGSQYKMVYLRDQGGQVYEIDNIQKYSDHRDFVVFTVKNNTKEDFLSLNTAYKINSRVYAVGNAHGEGVIIRDGLLTSQTPEEENGEWKWLRFSAAASPGNSGGPLLDNEGKVIGVVLRKSQNENLNFALPVSEIVNSENDTAISHKKFMFGLDNMNKMDTEVYDFKVKLPLVYSELNEKLQKNKKTFIEGLIAKVFTKYTGRIFPGGEKSETVLYNNYATVFPNLVAESKDGFWSTYKPSEIRTADLKDNGYIQYGSMDAYFMMYIKKPESLKLNTFLTDTKLFMDTILSGVPLSRSIGSDSVRVTSLGNAAESSTYKDKYNRIWLVNSWKVTYSDEKILTYSLPVPGGVVTMLRMGETGKVDLSYSIDTKTMADFIYLSYYGTFEEWTEFMTLKQFLPDILSGVEFSFVDGKSMNFKSKRLNLSYDNSLLPITKNSDLELICTYFKEKDSVIWDISGLILGKDKNSQTAFSIVRNLKPPQTLKESYQDDWKKINEQKFPYNKTSYSNNGKTIIMGLHPQYINSKTPNNFVYTVSYSEEGNIEAADAGKMIDKVIGVFKINE